MRIKGKSCYTKKLVLQRDVMYALLLRNGNKLSRSPLCVYKEDSR